MPIVRTATNNNNNRNGRDSPSMAAPSARHIDKGKITDDIYRSMIQQLFPATAQFLDASTRMELAFTHVQQCSNFFFESLGRTADCAMGSAVSSDMADTLVDMSDTYLRMVGNISSKMPELKSSLMDIISKKFQLSIKSTPMALREHNSLMRSKTEKLAKTVKELHKCNEKSLHRNTGVDERLDRSLNAFKEADSDLREYKDFAYKIAIVEERRFIATFIELVSQLTEAYLNILQVQIDTLKEKTMKWSETSNHLKEKLHNPIEDFDFRHGAPMHGMGGSASGYSGSENSTSDRNAYGSVKHSYNGVYKEGKGILVHESENIGNGSLPRMKVTFKRNSYIKKAPVSRKPIVKTDTRENQQNFWLNNEGRDSQRQKRSKTGVGRVGGNHQRHNALILIDSNAGETISQAQKEINHAEDLSKGAKREGSSSRPRGGQSVKVEFSFVPQQKGDGIQLEMQEGDVIHIIQKGAPLHNGWQYGVNKRTSKQGWFPISFTQPMPTKAAAEHDENDYEQLSEEYAVGGGGGVAVGAGSASDSSIRGTQTKKRLDLPAPDYNSREEIPLPIAINVVNMNPPIHNQHHQLQHMMPPAPPPPPPPPHAGTQQTQHHVQQHGIGGPSSGDSSPERSNLFANAKLRKPSVVNDRSRPVLR